MTAVMAAAVRPLYPAEEAALRRVEALKTHGIWTGYYQAADGQWRLLYDPEGVYR